MDKVEERLRSLTRDEVRFEPDTGLVSSKTAMKTVCTLLWVVYCQEQTIPPNVVSSNQRDLWPLIPSGSEDKNCDLEDAHLFMAVFSV